MANVEPSFVIAGAINMITSTIIPTLNYISNTQSLYDVIHAHSFVQVQKTVQL